MLQMLNSRLSWTDICQLISKLFCVPHSETRTLPITTPVVSLTKSQKWKFPFSVSWGSVLTKETFCGWYMRTCCKQNWQIWFIGFLFSFANLTPFNLWVIVCNYSNVIHPGNQFQILYHFKDGLFVIVGELIFLKPQNFLGVAEKSIYRKHVYVFCQISTQYGMKSFGSRALE